MNPDGRFVDRERAWVDAERAARILGVKRATLYSYASRGLVRSTLAPRSRRRVYHREDLERLHARSVARSGHGPVAAGALRWGEPVLETCVGTIRDDGPWYRGRSALALARDGASFEDACAILWQSEMPRRVRRVRRARGDDLEAVRALLAPSAEPFDAMLVAAGALAAREPRVEEPSATLLAGAPRLVRRVIASPALALSLSLSRAVARARGSVAAPGARAASFAGALAADGAARSLLGALGGEPTRANVAAMDAALVLSADHELNASTFAARVASSAGANLAACVLGALATLSGPRHGAAASRVEAFVHDVGAPERAAAAVRARLDAGEPVPGFGHKLYPKGDPRGAHLLALAVETAPRARGVRVAVAIADAMDLASGDRPTIDLGLAALAAALDLPRGAPIAIFAAGRLAGWIAHVLEQREAGFLLRPRARYAGA